MIEKITLIYIIILYLSMPGFLGKAGYNLWIGFLPIINIYYFLKVLEINPYLLLILSLGIIFLPARMFLVTLIFVFLPFLIGDCYEEKMIFSFLALLLPFPIYPFIAYFHGEYQYIGE